MPQPTPLILLAGMGADERLFAPQAQAFPQLVVPKWIEPYGDESIAAYAKRLAKGLKVTGPCFVGGASFGGFVAIEMARHFDARACFLIGSLRGPQELPLRVRALRRLGGATRVVPFEWVCRAAGRSVELFGFCSGPRTRQLLRQLSDADAKFLRWATRAVLTWQPAPPPPNVPVYHIHGDRDHVLPVSRTRADRIVRGAGHVLSLTHAADVNDFLRSHMRRHTPTRAALGAVI
jgi:pimeloyl-ACP methyl ester carboxylesterase